MEYDIICQNGYINIYDYKCYIYKIEFIDADINDEIYELFINYIDLVFSSGKKFGIIYDLMNITAMIPPIYIYRFVTYLKNHKDILMENLLGTSVLTANILGKFLINLVLSLKPPQLFVI